MGTYGNIKLQSVDYILILFLHTLLHPSSTQLEVTFFIAFQLYVCMYIGLVCTGYVCVYVCRTVLPGHVIPLSFKCKFDIRSENLKLLCDARITKKHILVLRCVRILSNSENLSALQKQLVTNFSTVSLHSINQNWCHVPVLGWNTKEGYARPHFLGKGIKGLSEDSEDLVVHNAYH